MEEHLEKASAIQQGWWERVAFRACGGVPRGVICVEVGMESEWMVMCCAVIVGRVEMVEGGWKVQIVSL